MTPKFTTPCFIRKNTPELRKKLEELGYALSDHVKGHYTNEIYCYDKFCFSYSPLDCSKKAIVDCGENEQLFLALAALREDSDKFQWFCDNEEEEYKSLFFCKYDDVEKHIHNEMDGWDCEGFHKATPAELIEHFKEK